MKTEETINQETFESRIIRKSVFYLDSLARPTPNFQLLPSPQSDGARPQAPGRPVRQSGAASQALVGAPQSQAVSEGSLPLMVAVSLGTNRIQRDGEGRGEDERVGKGGERGPGRLLEGNQEGIRRRDLEGYVGVSGRVAKSHMIVTTKGYIIERITK